MPIIYGPIKKGTLSVSVMSEFSTEIKEVHAKKKKTTTDQFPVICHIICLPYQ